MDVIICLGNTFINQKTIEDMELRTEKAVELYLQKKTKIIFSGGYKSRKDISEAKYMADQAEKMGVLSLDIVLEEKANNTIDSACYCKEILGKYGFKSAVIVTSPHHMRRVKYIFKKIIPDINLKFKKCKNNFNFFEGILFDCTEIKKLIKLKIYGVNYFRT